MKFDNLVLQPSSTAQWYALVNEAEQATAVCLAEDIESYLVFLLMRYSAHPKCMDKILAVELLDSCMPHGMQAWEKWRDLGDTCLLFAGLFPGMAERRRVGVSYYVELGQGAYDTLSDYRERGLAQLFSSLSHSFVILIDTLHAMREMAGEPLLMPSWQEAKLALDTYSKNDLTEKSIIIAQEPKIKH